MNLAYVAGPFRAPTTWQIHEHVHRAQQVGIDLAYSTDASGKGPASVS